MPGKKPSKEEHLLLTITDIFEKIPEKRIDDFLNDLRGMMKYHKQIEKALSQLARSEVKAKLSEGITWIDDGRRDIKLQLTSND